MKEDASLIRNTAAPRYSSGLLSFPSMFCLGHSTFRSGYSLKSSSVIAVTMYPGDIVLTRIPCAPHSDARLRASCTTPAFEALYAGHIRPYLSLAFSKFLIHGSAYSVCYGCAHARNQSNATPVPIFYHLLCNSLRGHKDTGNVDLKHHICIFRSII